MSRTVEVEVGSRVVSVTNPDKVYFPAAGVTKLDLVRYYIAVGEAALRGVARRPVILKRFVDGIDAAPFFQKRAPQRRPDWVRTAEIRYPSGRAADLVVCDEVAALAWMANLGCVDLNPWPVRAEDVEHPDELRVDLDPGPGVTFDDVRTVAIEVGRVLEEHGYRSFPKTSGSRGIHVLVRVRPEHGFEEVRRAALALAREVERRLPTITTTAWWKEERHGVFLDYNQNARDRTVASAYSVRAVPDARVSCPLDWDEVAEVDPAAWTIATVPARLAERGDLHAAIDEQAFPLDPLLELVAEQERDGLGDAPWPPQFPKAPDEPTRVAPSRRAASTRAKPKKPQD